MPVRMEAKPGRAVLFTGRVSFNIQISPISDHSGSKSGSSSAFNLI